MIVADRDATNPPATAAASSGRTGRFGTAGEPGPRQQISREGNPAPGLRDTDPQPVPQELGRVPAPVISRIRVVTDRPSYCSGADFGRRSAGTSVSVSVSGPVSAWPALPVTQPAGSVTAVSPQPVTQPTAAPEPTVAEPTVAERAAATASRRVRSTDPAATTCRNSPAREISSTHAANSADSRKPRFPASATAVEHTPLSSSRLRSKSPDPPPSDPTDGVPPSDAAEDVQPSDSKASERCGSAGTLRRPRPRAAGC